MRTLGISLAAVLAAATGLAAPKPNVLFLLADDLGYGEMGAFGQRHMQTPHLDRLAAEGMRFTQAYAGETVCAPSRCALMTGQHNGHSWIRGNKEIEPEGQEPMQAGTFTIAQLMKNADYHTAIIGKWGLGYPTSESVPNKMGFDYFFGYNCQRQAHNYFPDHLWRNAQQVPLDGKTYSDDLFMEESLAFLRQNRDRPFFLYLAFTLPHLDLQAPPLPQYESQPWTPRQKKIANQVTRLDTDIGRVMALLKELGLDERTLVIFASDNGAVYHDPLFQDSGGLRGFKRDMYEGGLRSPAIVRWTGRIPAGQVSKQVWTFWDVMPTLADLTGQKIPPGMDGVSVLPAWLNGKPVLHPPLYFEFHERGFTQAARIGDWKAVSSGTKQPLELYNLEADPDETHNEAAAHPELVKRFTDYLKTARTNSALFPINEKVPPAPKGGDTN